MSEQASLPAAGGLLSLNLSMLPQGSQSAASNGTGLFTGFSTMLAQQGGSPGQMAEFSNGALLPPQAAALPLQAQEALSAQELFNQRLVQMAQLLEQQQQGQNAELPEEVSAELARALRQYTEQQPVMTSAAEGGGDVDGEGSAPIADEQASELSVADSAETAETEAAEVAQTDVIVDALTSEDAEASSEQVNLSAAEDVASAATEVPAASMTSGQEQAEKSAAAAAAAAGVAAEQARVNARAADAARQGDKVPSPPPLQGDSVKQVPAAEHAAAHQIHAGAAAPEGAETVSLTTVARDASAQSGAAAGASRTDEAKVAGQGGGNREPQTGTTGQSSQDRVMQQASAAQSPMSDAEAEGSSRQEVATARAVTQLSDQTAARAVPAQAETAVEQESIVRQPIDLKGPQKFETALDMTKQLLQKMASAEKSDGASGAALEKPTTALAGTGQSLAQPNQAQRVVTEAQNLMMPQQVRMNTPAWNNALGERAVMIAAQNSRVAEIQLDPPELGSLSVRVNVNQDQVSLSFSSPHAHVRDAVEQSLPRLREMFAEQGLALQDSSVSDQSAEQQSREQLAGESSERGYYGDAAGPEGAEETVSRAGRPVSLVDYYA